MRENVLHIAADGVADPVPIASRQMICMVAFYFTQTLAMNMSIACTVTSNSTVTSAERSSAAFLMPAVAHRA